MDLGKITASGRILDEEDEEEDDKRYSYATTYSINPSEEEVRKARRRKAEYVFEEFLRPEVEELDRFSLTEIQEQIRPPYNQEEIGMALDYAVDEGHLEEDDGVYTLIS